MSAISTLPSAFPSAKPSAKPSALPSAMPFALPSAMLFALIFLPYSSNASFCIRSIASYTSKNSTVSVCT
ncbi:MAG: hypothetical protein E7505_01365 [Ruminococcus sp.]|nr:hypothetical protein [Ruminococcus sp.]